MPARWADSTASQPARPRSRRHLRTYRLIGSALAVTYGLTLPLMASAGAPISHRSSLLPITPVIQGRNPLSRQQQQQSVAARFFDTVQNRLQQGGDALPRASGPAASSSHLLLARQDDNTAAPPDEVDNSHGPDSDQPITIGSTPFSPLILLIAGLAFSAICCLIIVCITKCGNPNESQTGRDRLRAQQDLRLRGAGRRSGAEPFVFSSRAPSGISTPTGTRNSRLDRRPPPRSGMHDSISSRSPLYASHLSHASGSVAGSEHPLIPGVSGLGRGGVDSFLSTSSGPFGDSQAALAALEMSNARNSAAPSRGGAGDIGSSPLARSQHRPGPLPLPSPTTQTLSWEILPGQARKSINPPRPSTSMSQNSPGPRARTSSGAKTSRSSTIGKGTDLYRNRGSRAFVPAVNPSAMMPAAMPTYHREYNTAHPLLDGSTELKRHLTDPSGSLSPSRRNSMLSLSVGSGSNDSGGRSPNELGGSGFGAGTFLGQQHQLVGGGSSNGGGGASPDSAASSSQLSSFSNGLATGPLLPLGSSYLSSGGGGGVNVPTGDLVGSGFFGAAAAGGGGGGYSDRAGGVRPPPIPAQKSIYHTRPAVMGPSGPRSPGGGSGSSNNYGASSAGNQNVRSAVYDYNGPSSGGGASRSAAPVGRVGQQQQQQQPQSRWDADVEAGGAAGVQTGLLAGREALPNARQGRYARRPGGPR
ncbi:hypothetical protein V8E36_006141 [Tilletia maclaganii]